MSSLRTVMYFLCSIGIVAGLSGCKPDSPGSSKKSAAGEPDKHKVCIENTCQSTDCASAAYERIEVEPGDLVEFCNNTECVVKIRIESSALFGEEWKRVEPGTCGTYRVRSGAAGNEYNLEMHGDCCGGTIGNPVVVVGGGGGSGGGG